MLMVVGGGYPIQSWWGGTPSSHGGGYPIQSWWGIPHPVMGGVPGVPPPSRPGWATPHHPDLTGVPLPTIQTWPGYSPTIQTWLEYPPPSRPGWGTHPPTIKTWLGYPPVELWTDKQTENSTFPHPSDAGDNNKMQ